MGIKRNSKHLTRSSSQKASDLAAGPMLVIDPLPDQIITNYSGHSSFAVSARIDNEDSVAYKFIIEKTSCGEIIHKDKILGLHFLGSSMGFNRIQWQIRIDPLVYPVGQIHDHCLTIKAIPVSSERKTMTEKVNLCLGRGGISPYQGKNSYLFDTNPATPGEILKFIAVKEDCDRIQIDKTPFLERHFSVSVVNAFFITGDAPQVKLPAADLIDNLGLSLEVAKEQPFSEEAFLVYCHLENRREIPVNVKDPAKVYFADLVIQKEERSGAKTTRQKIKLPFQFQPAAIPGVQPELNAEIKLLTSQLARHLPVEVGLRLCEMLNHLQDSKTFPVTDLHYIRQQFSNLASSMMLEVKNSSQALAAWEERLEKLLFTDEKFCKLYLKSIIAAYTGTNSVLSALSRKLENFFYRYITVYKQSQNYYDFMFYEKEKYLALISFVITQSKKRSFDELPDKYLTINQIKPFLLISYFFYREFRDTERKLAYRNWNFEKRFWYCLLRALGFTSQSLEAGFLTQATEQELLDLGQVIFPEIKWQEKQEKLLAILIKFWALKPDMRPKTIFSNKKEVYDSKTD